MKHIGFVYTHNTSTDIMMGFNGYESSRLHFTTTDGITFFCPRDYDGSPSSLQTLTRIHNEVTKLNAVLVYDNIDRDTLSICRAFKETMPEVPVILLDPRWNNMRGHMRGRECYTKLSPFSIPRAIRDGIDRGSIGYHFSQASSRLWPTREFDYNNTLPKIMRWQKVIQVVPDDSIDHILGFGSIGYWQYRREIMRVLGLDPTLPKTVEHSNSLLHSYYDQFPKLTEIERFAYPQICIPK